MDDTYRRARWIRDDGAQDRARSRWNNSCHSRSFAGSIVPAMLGQALGWYHTGEPAGIISSVVGAIFLSCVYLALLMRELRETDLNAKRSSH